MAEGELADRRKVTILVSDPDATDSSSDEEPQIKRPKRVVRQVFIGKSGALTGKSGEVTGSDPDPDPGTGSVKFPGVRKRKWGKWCAEIKNPFDKRRVWLGTFKSPEEASKAWVSKKQEFDEMAKAKQGTKKILLPLPDGIYKSMNPGKVYSVIVNPINNKKIYLGTFGTVEEAQQAQQTKKLKLEEEMKKIEEKKNLNSTFEESEVRELGESKESQESEVAEVQSSDSSSISCNGDGGGGEEKDGGDDGGMWVPMPDGTEVKFSVKYGIPIIDNYGFLLGELRRLDDDLWICRPGDGDGHV